MLHSPVFSRARRMFCAFRALATLRPYVPQGPPHGLPGPPTASPLAAVRAPGPACISRCGPGPCARLHLARALRQPGPVHEGRLCTCAQTGTTRPVPVTGRGLSRAGPARRGCLRGGRPGAVCSDGLVCSSGRLVSVPPAADLSRLQQGTKAQGAGSVRRAPQGASLLERIPRHIPRRIPRRGAFTTARQARMEAERTRERERERERERKSPGRRGADAPVCSLLRPHNGPKASRPLQTHAAFRISRDRKAAPPQCPACLSYVFVSRHGSHGCPRDIFW